jgi:hypothetical protein
MGMFDNDVLFGGERLDKHVTIGTDSTNGERVALLDAVIVSDEVPTSLGNATKTLLKIGKLDKDYKIIEVQDLGTLAKAIADKVRLKEDGDLPAVVSFFTTPSKFDNDATVMQFVSKYDGKVPVSEALKEGIPL